MLRDLEDGVDVHNIACGMCFPHIKQTGDRKKDYTPMQQLIAKTVVFGTFFGRSAHSIAIEFATSVADASSWQLKLVNKYPGVAKYKVVCETAFNRQGYLETPFGRRRYLTTLTQGFNFPVQGTAADIILRSIVLSDQAGLWNWITVHDNLVIQVPEAIDMYKDQFGTFRSVMERKVPELENMRFKITYTEGRDWCNMEEVKA